MSWARKCTQCFGFFPDHELVDERCPRHRLAEGQVRPVPVEPRTPVRVPRGEPKRLHTRYCSRCGRRESVFALEGGICPDCQQVREQAKVIAMVKARRKR